MSTKTEKPCPKCGFLLFEEKDGRRWCRSGCEIVTAVPRGNTYGTTRKDAKDGLSFTCDGGIRRLPTTKS